MTSPKADTKPSTSSSAVVLQELLAKRLMLLQDACGHEAVERPPAQSSTACNNGSSQNRLQSTAAC